MDDQNTTQPTGTGASDPTGGAQPVSNDTTLPWMNFAPEAPVAGDASSAGAASSGTTGDAAATPAPASFDPFGNPFAAPADTAAAFAPSPTDGSMPAAEPAPFMPSEPTAFTAEPSFTPPEAPVAAPSADTSLAWSTGGTAATSSDDDTLTVLKDLKTKFDAEEEEFNRQIEEHNANIQFEKEAINKLRSERSERLSQMRDVVRDLEDMLGIKKQQENRPAPKHDEPRKAERVQPKKQNDSGINDFLAA